MILQNLIIIIIIIILIIILIIIIIIIIIIIMLERCKLGKFVRLIRPLLEVFGEIFQTFDTLLDCKIVLE